MKWLMNKVNLKGQHAWWQVILSEFDYEIQSKPGSKNGNADVMLRIPGQGISTMSVKDEPTHFSLLSSIVHKK